MGLGKKERVGAASQLGWLHRPPQTVGWSPAEHLGAHCAACGSEWLCSKWRNKPKGFCSAFCVWVALCCACMCLLQKTSAPERPGEPVQVRMPRCRFSWAAV